VHWDLSGNVNGYGSPYELPIVFVAVCVPMVLSPDERASWLRSTSAAPAVIWTVVAIGVVVSGATVLATASTGGRYWAVSFIPLALIPLSLSMFAWTVRVDTRGVLIRAALGVPVFRIPLDQITSANAADVQALAQYGGWGIRIALNSRIGIIVRSGEALEIHRLKGLAMVVTVEDATTAAALINGLVAQRSAAMS
jgi:hypothetical protein